MSSTINGISNNSDMQAMIVSMYNKINNATIEASKSSQNKELDTISASDFVKSLEEQYQKKENLNPQVKQNFQGQINMPMGMEISEDNTITKDSFKELVNSIMDNLDENSDGKISKQEIKDFTENLSVSQDSETTGSLASSKAGDFLKNQASNFIQKLIDRYKDNSESILGIFV